MKYEDVLDKLPLSLTYREYLGLQRRLKSTGRTKLKDIRLNKVLLPCISWPWVVSWPPSSYFEISINLKACIILEWSIIIRFVITTTFKTCADTHSSV